MEEKKTREDIRIKRPLNESHIITLEIESYEKDSILKRKNCR